MTVFAPGTGGFVSAEKEPPKVLIINPDEAPAVLRAYEMALNRSTYAAIREYLKSVSSRKWTTTTVKYLLQNETYTGLQLFGDWRKEDAHEAIVDRALWDAVQEIVAVPRGRQPKHQDDFVYYLRERQYAMPLLRLP